AKTDQDQVVEILRISSRKTGENRRAKAGRQQFPASAGLTRQTSPVYGFMKRSDQEASPTWINREGTPVPGFSQSSSPSRRTSNHRAPARSFFGGFPTPALYCVDRSRRPASETLHDSGHSRDRDRAARFDRLC